MSSMSTVDRFTVENKTWGLCVSNAVIGVGIQKKNLLKRGKSWEGHCDRRLRFTSHATSSMVRHKCILVTPSQRRNCYGPPFARGPSPELRGKFVN